MPPFALVVCSVAAVLGTFAVTAPSLPLDQRAIAGAGLCAVCLFAASGRCEPRSFRALVIAALVGAALNAWAHERTRPVIAEHRTARYAGTFLGDDTVAFDGGLHVLAHLRDAPAIGSRVVLRGRLAPFDESRNPGEPSERAIQRERGIDAQLEGADIISIHGNDRGAWLARLHAWAYAQLHARLGEPYAAIVAGELWGERTSLPPDLHAEFQETGTVHVLVTAGLHIGAVAALCVAVLSLFALPRWATCAIAVAGVWLFVAWSGAQLPAVRAASMATAALAARACGRATFSWNSLAIAALVVAFARPESVATASFALSFSCVGAIFACAPTLECWIGSAVALPERVREALVLSLATQLGTWPLTAAIFLQFAPYALFANLAVVPCVALTMALGALQLALSWCAPLAQACANLNSWPLAWMLATVRALATLPGASIPMTPGPAWCVVAYDLALACAPSLLRRDGATIAIASLVLGTSLVLWPPRAIEARLRVTVLDVGQADSIVVQTPRGHALLVDAGGRLERGAQGNDSAELVGERTVVPFLLRQGIHAIDALIVSHPHGDHVGGCAPVLRKIRVGEIADGGQTYGGHAYHDCLDTARAQGVPIVYPRAGMEWRTDDGLTLHFIGPSLPLVANSRNDINENSVAFVLRYRSFCMLFTGDAGAAAEQRFLSEGVDLRCDVLKVGHHGSAYSSTPAFIAAVHPRYAIISVGRHNLFGHPAPSTIETLEQSGAAIFRTDESGAVGLATDGKTIGVAPQLSKP
jgi:competence protein ComEC